MQVKNYAKAVRLVLERERANGAEFPAAWRRAMAERPAPADWRMESSERTTALDYLERIFGLAYHGHGPETALSDDLLPDAKDATVRNVERDGCRSRAFGDRSLPCPHAPLQNDTFCVEHRVILDRVRAEVEGAPVSKHMLVDFDPRAEMAA